MELVGLILAHHRLDDRLYIKPGLFQYSTSKFIFGIPAVLSAKMAPVKLDENSLFVLSLSIIAILWLGYSLTKSNGFYPNINVVGVDDKRFCSFNRARSEFKKNGRSLIRQGLQQVSSPNS